VKANSQSALLLLAAALMLIPTGIGTRSNNLVPMLVPSGPVLYDEQLSLSFVENFTDLAVDVTAVQQCGSDGLGPAYLLNGLSDAGYWYQVGLSWNWPLVRTNSNGNSNVTSSSGFNAVFETWLDVNPLTPPTLTPVNVNAGDTVRLGLHISGGSVFMEVHDLVNGESASLEWNAFHAQRFVGTPHVATNGGLFTGLMTEQYHTSPYYGNEQKVTYELSDPPLTSAWMVINEWIPANDNRIFFQDSRVNYTGPFDSHNLSYVGAFETSNANEFVTGSLDSGPTCAPPLSFWVSYRYPITGIGATVAIAGALLLRRRRNRAKAPDQKSDSPTARSPTSVPADRPPQRPP
jgi:hypothetical protein